MIMYGPNLLPTDGWQFHNVTFKDDAIIFGDGGYAKCSIELGKFAPLISSIKLSITVGTSQHVPDPHSASIFLESLLTSPSGQCYSYVWTPSEVRSYLIYPPLSQGEASAASEELGKITFTTEIPVSIPEDASYTFTIRMSGTLYEGSLQASMETDALQSFYEDYGKTEETVEVLNKDVSDLNSAVDGLASQIAAASGLYSTIEEGASGNVYYLHDRPVLSESALVLKLNAAGIAISRNGGLTWDWGFSFVTGEAIAQTIHAGAGWIEELFATQVTASNLTVSGNSNIAGWNVTNGKIYGGDSDTGTAVIQRPGGASGTATYVFAAGGTSHDSYSDCPFRVAKDGTLYAEKARIAGTVTASSLSVMTPDNLGLEFIYNETGRQSAHVIGAALELDKGNYLQTWVKERVGTLSTDTPVNLIGVTSGGNVTIGASTAYGATSDLTGRTIIHGNTVELVFRDGMEVSAGDPHIVADYSSSYFPRFRPNTDKGCNLGNPAYRWNDGYVDSMHTSSDRKLKDNITALTDNDALERFFMAVSPTMYTMKDGKRPHMGFIAQQLAEAAMDSVGDLAAFCASCVDERGEASDFVPGTPDENLRWDLRYNELIAPLWAMVQLQQRRIEALEQRQKGSK